MTDNPISYVVKEFIRDSSKRALLDIGKNIDNLRNQYCNPNPVIIESPKITISQEVQQVQQILPQIVAKEISSMNNKIETLSKPIYRKVTYDINRTDINNKKSYPVTEIYGMGKITELSILTNAKPELEIYIDGRHMFNLTLTPFDDLARISTFSKDITADVVPPNFVISVRDIKFMKTFKTNIYFTNPSNILSIYCKYELCEEI